MTWYFSHQADWASEVVLIISDGWEKCVKDQHTRSETQLSEKITIITVIMSFKHIYKNPLPRYLQRSDDRGECGFLKGNIQYKIITNNIQTHMYQHEWHFIQKQRQISETYKRQTLFLQTHRREKEEVTSARARDTDTVVRNHFILTSKHYLLCVLEFCLHCSYRTFPQQQSDHARTPSTVNP